MGADIENPDHPDGCVAEAETSRNPNDGEDVDDKAAMSGRNGVGGGDVVAADAEHIHCYCGWPNNVLYVCSAIFYLGAVACTYPLIRDRVEGKKDNTQHLLLACIGMVGGLIISLFPCFVAANIQEKQNHLSHSSRAKLGMAA